jgi:hypothetical protein
MLKKLFACLLALGVMGMAAGCVVQTYETRGDTRVSFEETINLGYYCGGPLTSWTVYNRQTEEQGTAGCEQPVLFVGLYPNTTYTFDIYGYSGQELCWEGTCNVHAYGGRTTFADCSRHIVSYCGF